MIPSDFPSRSDGGLFGVPETKARPVEPQPLPESVEYEDVSEPEAALVTPPEPKHGVIATAKTQFFRGVLDTLLAPGALAGAYTETAGSALGVEAIRDFGRDMGTAASGKSALEALSFVLEGGGEGGAAAAVQSNRELREQEEGRPLLSTVARYAGMAAPAIATGGIGAGASPGALSGARLAIAGGAIEGAGGGAQSAYEQNAALNDVLASAGIGALLGAAVPAGVVGVQKGIKKLAGSGLGDTVREGLVHFSQERGAKAIGFQGSSLKKLGRSAPAAEAEMRQVVDDVMAHTLDDGTPVFQATQTQEDLAGRLFRGREELGAKLGALRSEVDDFIESAAPELRPSPTELAARIEREVVAPLENSGLDAVRAIGRETREQVVDGLRGLGDSASLAQVRQFQEDLASIVYPKSPTGQMMPPTRDVRGLFQADRLIEDQISTLMDTATARMGRGSVYKDLKRLDHSFITASKVAGGEMQQDLGRRVFSLSDTLIGASALAGDIASGGALSALKALGAAGLAKFARERSSSVFASLANRLARTPKPKFSVAAVGGREAVDVLEELGRVRTFVKEASEAAGDNPNVRRVADGWTRDVASEELGKRAGDFDPAVWSRRTPNPLQKVLYRGQLLDAASGDMAKAANTAQAMRPKVPDALDPGRLKKLLKDADGPAAIGGLQNTMRELAENAPPTSVGADMAQAMRMAADELDRAELPDAFALAHGLRQRLGAQGDAWADRAAEHVRARLGGPEMGEAGARYAALTAPPNQAAQNLADATSLRDILRTLDSRGQLPAAMRNANESILSAYEARAKLTGEAMPAGLKKQLQTAEDLFAAGEEAATLDGRSVSRLFEHLDEAPKGSDPRRAVWDAVAPEIDRLVPLIRNAAGKSKSGRYRLKHALHTVAEPAQSITAHDVRHRVESTTPRGPSTAIGSLADRVSMLPDEQRAEYDKRLDKLRATVGNPGVLAQADVHPNAAPLMGEKMAQLLQDIPKPANDIRGKAMESLSSDDLRLAAAMWEATVEPLSVLSDFRAGVVDYDKVKYAWKQWPGLQVAVQAGILDVIQQDLDDDERAGMSDSMLTQLDFLGGFGGRLQSSADPEFSARISSLNVPPEQAGQPPPGGPIQTPKANPTFTERVAGAV